jgi:predicted DNA-binding transcriptional regulator AlpA
MNNQLITIPVDRLIREPERKRLTSVCRTGAWELEKKGLFPKRRKLHPVRRAKSVEGWRCNPSTW